MDLNAVVRFLYAKHELILGASITLLLIVTVLMLVRSVLEDRQAGKASGDSGASLDPKALNAAVEGAMKKVLSDKGIQSAIGSATAASEEGGAAPEAIELKKSLTEKEAKIADLMKDIEALKTATESAQPTADGGVTTSSADVSGLEAKLAELQAKLAEYEIIEDDIADLSMYKEENKKLKTELANLKAAVETAQTQVHAANVSVEPAPRDEDPVQVAQAAVTAAVPPAPETAAPVAEKFELDPNDSVMNEFAQAISSEPQELPEVNFESQLVVSSDSPLVDPQAAIDAILSQTEANEPAVEAATQETATEEAVAEPVAAAAETTDNVAVDVASLDKEMPGVAEITAEPVSTEPVSTEDVASVLDESLDTNKLQAEVSKLAAELESMALAADGEGSVLDENLDTDKLMKELAGSEENALDAPRESAVPADRPEVVEAGTKPKPSAAIEDDLLAEFKDLDFQNTKTTKGS